LAGAVSGGGEAAGERHTGRPAGWRSRPSPPCWRRTWAPLATLLCFTAWAGPAERGGSWRVYKAADGLRESLTTAVTVSPRGNVWVKHGEVDAISLLDGYSVVQTPAPGERNYRVSESRAGKIWSVYDQGLIEFQGDRWERYPILEVRREHESNPLRQLRQIPLLPAEQDRVLLLLPDRLLEFRSLRSEVTVLRSAQDSQLGRFSDFAAARNGDVWITGTKGVARVPGPLRQIGAATRWEEHRIPETLEVGNLQRPFENDEGGVTTVGDSTRRERRMLVNFDGTNWLTRELPGENLRFAWQGGGRGWFWGLTLRSLVRLYPDHHEVVKEGPAAGQYFDVAAQPEGGFWLATLEGLVRFAPLAWRTPTEPSLPEEVVYSLLEDPQGRIWLAAATGLVGGKDGRWKHYPWPPRFEAAFRARDGLFALADGKLAISATEQLVLFDPETGAFQTVKHPAGRLLKKVLRQLPSRDLCLQTAEPANAGVTYHFEVCNGREFRADPDAPPPLNAGSELFFVARAQNGDFWLGGSSGPALWRDRKWQRFGASDGYVDDGALCWLELADGRIWCAGLGRISEFDGKSWTVVRTGFDRVSAMTRTSDDSIWVATSSGLYRYHKEAWVWVGEEEGLPSSATYAVLEDRTRRLWVATARGLSEYFPRADVEPPKTLVTRPRKGEEVAAESGVQVQFEGTDKWRFTPSDRLLYSFRLDEGKWSSYARETTVLLRSLTAGKHRFEVRAMDRNWNVEPRPAQLEFQVVVPWYRETRLIAVGIAGGLAALFFAGLAVNRHIQLRLSYARVEKMVDERTRELKLATEELVHSQKMTALGTLAAGLAHDFNNLLSIIRGSAQVIEGHLEDREKVLTRVARIKTMADQGAGLVKAMLGFGRMGDRSMTSCDVGQVIEDTIRLLGDRFLSEVALVRDIPARLPPVRGIKDLMQQMLLNLILNAADALEGRGEIRLSAGRLASAPAHVTLLPGTAPAYVFVAVRDTGCGIAPEVLPRIFEPFFTTKAFSSRRGTGLGLFTVYEFGRQMGHGLMVESEPGKGSTFTILMPVAEAHELPTAGR